MYTSTHPYSHRKKIESKAREVEFGAVDLSMLGIPLILLVVARTGRRPVRIRQISIGSFVDSPN